jgi:hypothetical protein
MFQSYTYEYRDYDQATGQWRYEITITDPDFGEETVEAVAAWRLTGSGGSGGLAATAVAAIGVIKCYDGKGYSVNQIAKNLWLLFEFSQRQYSRWSIKDHINWCLLCLPEYQPYHTDIQMLMLFS